MQILEETISYLQPLITAVHEFTVMLTTYSAVNCLNFHPTLEVH